MEKSSNRMWISLVALAATILLLSSLGGENSKPKSSAVKADQVQSQSETKQPESSTAMMVTSSEDKRQVNYTGITGETALASLQKQAQVDTKATSYGDMVTGINGIAPDETKEYWSFYVNDVAASEGAGTYVIKDGDKLMWKVEAIQ